MIQIVMKEFGSSGAFMWMYYHGYEDKYFQSGNTNKYLVTSKQIISEEAY